MAARKLVCLCGSFCFMGCFSAFAERKELSERECGRVAGLNRHDRGSILEARARCICQRLRLAGAAAGAAVQVEPGVFLLAMPGSEVPERPYKGEGAMEEGGVGRMKSVFALGLPECRSRLSWRWAA